MILYFANRNMEILGHATTSLRAGYVIRDDLKIEDVETGVAMFEFKVSWANGDEKKLKAMATVGNYLLRKNGQEYEAYVIVDAEKDTKNREVWVNAEDTGLDLLNEIADEYTAPGSYPITTYINKWIGDSGFEIGINECPDSTTRKLSWDGESTVTGRLASIAEQFGNYEISYSFAIKGMAVTNKYVNIHKQRGRDDGAQLRLNRDIDRIITKESIANLATGLKCTGGTPEDAENPITLKGYKYDDGDFYVGDSGYLYSRKASEKWGRFAWKEVNPAYGGVGFIIRPYSYDTLDQATLCTHAIAELKKVCDMEVNYEVEISKLPDDIKIGDRVNVIDDAGEIYLSTRILLLETSVTQKTQRATLGEHLIKTSGISQKVAELAAKFAETSQSAARALQASTTAKSLALNAQAQVDDAVKSVEDAQAALVEASEAIENAKQAAADAQEAADKAQMVVDGVEDRVTSLESTVDNAQAAADFARQAAETANQKAVEARTAADNAQTAADNAQTAADNAQTSANAATKNANESRVNSERAVEIAANATATANAAKKDAATAQKDIDSLGDDLATLSNTMQADYARKTDLTEAEAKLQTQITQNAAQIESTATKVTKVDETANNAKELAEQAQTAAGAAQETADKATADAATAQTAAETAQAAADAAQSEADKANAAAATAQGVADKAKADLAAAEADLATVTSRVDATEEEITAAQEAVNAAQAAADKAQEDADTATQKAVTAQNTAATAVTNAANAQAAADNAADKAAAAQELANKAQGDAAEAQTKANEAAAAAAAAQSTANTAKENATAAQNKANEAAAAAAAADQAAKDADAKAAQAQTDLETARQNLADVTGRVDATVEEVEAAKAAVNTAQAAADKAKADAAAAQSTADTAKSNASKAQTAANNAKTAADNAQAAAEAAQNAADAAQADVDALAVRVTSAETKITQTSEKIALLATKEEVTETLGGYYRKEETESLIEQTSKSIRSSVSSEITEKVNKIEIGGRNLVPVSRINGAVDVETTEEFELRNVWASTFISNSNLVEILEPATQYTVRYNLELIEKTTVSTKFDMMVGFVIYSAAHSTWISLATGMNENAEIGATATVQVTFTTPTVWNDESIICYSRRWTTNGASPFGFDAFKVTNFKIEKGNKATDWAPAPEDVNEATARAQATADAAQASVTAAESIIEQLSDQISMLVTDENGASLMTQTADGGWTFSMSKVESTLDSTSKSLDELVNAVGSVDAAVDVLNQAVSDLETLNDYVRIGTYNDQPCIELGEAENDFVLRITNTEIYFADGTVIDREKMNINKAKVNELEQGGFAWVLHGNSMGLMWKGVES